MFNIKIITIGKIKEQWLDFALMEYEKRLSSLCKIEWILLKNQQELEKFLEKERSFICLDLSGREFSSIEFSVFLLNQLEKQKSKLTFVIGGAEGLTDEIKKRADSLVSLSKLTFTHQITRLIFLEQIYRCFEIDKKTGYHK